MSKNSRESAEYYGKGGRLKTSAAKELIKSAYTFECEEEMIFFHEIGLADIAHVLMLIEEGIIPFSEGKTLLEALLEFQETNINDIPLRVELGDIYNVRAGLLEEKIGHIAGWMHAGRPRREAINIGYLLYLRKLVLKFIRIFIRLIDEFLNQAQNHLDTIMPDFTYLQHAQPTSLGHYLLTFVYPALRDLDRFRATYKRINSCPAGSGSVNGSRLPLNRLRLKELLGFDEITQHTRDAMWQPDIPIETVSNLLALLINVNRLSEELQIWSTTEFDFIDLPDRFCRASVIMPQKKNPYPLTYIRGLTGDMIGVVSSIAGVAKTSSGNPDSRIFVYGKLPRILEQASKGIDLMASLVAEIKFNTDNMSRQAIEGFSQATDLADLIMQERKVDYRSAHQIVGILVREAIQKNEKRFILTPEIVDGAANQVLQKKLDLTQPQLDSILDPIAIIETRQGLGGAAKVRVQEMVMECRKTLKGISVWRDGCEERSLKQLDNLILVAKGKIEVGES
ncbi:MAG: argininosuccinate lyase [Candidatus Heimdallarchaeota archaeon]|nr:MAG: argininosuccinate lyase [Candidatus Heimdallarchaeota archaeon]